MEISAVPVPLQVKLPEVNTLKVDVRPDVQNGEAADGTRLPKPTAIAALPPGQGTRIDRFA